MKRWVRMRTSSAVPVELGRVDDVLAAELVTEARSDAPGDPDGHGGFVLDGQQSDRLVGRGGLAKEVDEQPALAGVLVGQERQHAVVLKHLDHLIEAARLGDQRLAGPFAEVAR